MEKRNGALQLEKWLEQGMEINPDKDRGLGEGMNLIKASEGEFGGPKGSRKNRAVSLNCLIIKQPPCKL